jgi:hypothetical protein
MVDDESSRNAWLNRRESVDELHTLPEAELVRRHDELVRELNRTNPRISATTTRQEYTSRIEAYLDELARRETALQGERMEALTRSLNRLTWVITIATIIGVCLTAWALLSG